ncbi:MAG: AAA family ATPase [Verrucomicrobiales bacterium]
MSAELPDWAREVIASYESGAASCFALHGNVADRFLVPAGKNGPARLASLSAYIEEVLVGRFEVVLSYDLGRGIRVERGEEEFSQWPSLKEHRRYPSEPLAAARFLNHYLTYLRNLQAVGAASPRVALIIRQAELACPALPNALNYDLHALASLWRSWASECDLSQHGQAVFFLTETLPALHPLVADCPQIARLEVSLPTVPALHEALAFLRERHPEAIEARDLPTAADRLRGTSLSAVESLLRRRHFEKKPLAEVDFGRLRKELVEAECEGLIAFIEPKRRLDDVIGLERVKDWLRQDLALWRRNELAALPMGYLFCGPVGTGKTYLAECLAGEAGVPVVVLKNFRDRWVGSTEANLEKIFALLHALGRCMIFIDEADQTLGKRASGSGDSGVSSRIYAMLAQEMSATRNRGKLLWILASSRPDLIEVDLKRPGRIDVKIPIFPALEEAEALALVKTLAGSRGMRLPDEEWTQLIPDLPALLTPGAAEALVVKALRLVKAEEKSPLEALEITLRGSRPAVSPETIKAQMRLAAHEATEAAFVPDRVEEVLAK